jgi:hypothetical protein
MSRKTAVTVKIDCAAYFIFPEKERGEKET